jgi:hypothetical protein
MSSTGSSPLTRVRALTVAAGLATASMVGACSGGDEPTPGQGGEGTDVNTDDVGTDESDGLQTDGVETDAGDTGTGNPNVGGSPEG